MGHCFINENQKCISNVSYLLLSRAFFSFRKISVLLEYLGQLQVGLLLVLFIGEHR